MGEGGAGGVDEDDLVVVEVDAVRQERALVEGAGALQPVGDAMAAAGDRVALVGSVLGGVDVETDAEVTSRLACRPQASRRRA